MTVTASFVMPPRDAFGNIAATPNPFTAAVQTEIGAKYIVAAPSGSGTVKVVAPSGTVIGSGTSVSFTATTASVVLVVESPAAGYITMSLTQPPDEELPVPSASGDVLTATGTAAGDYDWATPTGTVPTPPASGDVLTSTGSAAGDYDWAAPVGTVPTPPASGDVLTSTGTAAGDYDWAAPASGGGLLARTSYNPSTATSYSPSSTLTALDTTNLAVTFTVPSSGAVLVMAEAVFFSGTTGGAYYLGATNSAGQVGTAQGVADEGPAYKRRIASTLIGGLTAGDSLTWYLAAGVPSGTTVVVGGGTSGYGSASIAIWEAPS